MSYYRAKDTGPAVWGSGDLYTFLTTGRETDGAYFVMEGLVPPGGGPPAHIHYNQTEAFYIVEGLLEIKVDDRVYEAKAGDFVHVSKGTPHAFLNRTQAPVKMIFTFVPAGDVEEFFRSAFLEATDRHAPPPPLTDALIQRMVEAAARHDIEFLPPPEGGD